MSAKLFSDAVFLVVPIIKKHEGFFRDLKNGKVAAYLDPVNIPTIGWGTTQYANGKKVKMGDVITYQQAENELINMLQKKYNELLPHIKQPLNKYQLAALLSFAYNAGVGVKGDDKGLINKQFFKNFNATGDTATTAALFSKSTITAKGKVMGGLVKRRKEEANLFAMGGTMAGTTPEKKKNNFFGGGISDITSRMFNFFTGK